ncbi:MAG: gliding motility-associated-like protein [Paraglaciecola sp.]|jgi:gliding motility-associated-like protein
MKKIYLFITAFLLLHAGLNAQTIPWGTFGSSAGTQSNATATIIYTLGGCPNCGTAQGINGAFVSPVVDDTNPDCFTSAFDFDGETGNCGTVYNFFYTGNADVNAVTFEWDFGTGAFPQMSNSINPIGVAYGSIGSKQVTLRVFTVDCDVSVSSMFQVSMIGFAANPIITNVACKGEANGVIELEINGGTAPFSYTWSNGETTATLNNLEADDYAYTVTDAMGCNSMNGIAVTEPSDSLTVAFDKTSETCTGDLDGTSVATIMGGIAPYDIMWSDGSTAMSRIALAGGAYTLSITDANGCQLDDTVFINQACNPQIYNTISPNGDGVNDTWKITDILGYPENDLQIFNRWGAKVFNMTGYMNTWNGVNNNKEPLSAGAYYYVIRLNDEGNNVLTGSITIVR